MEYLTEQDKDNYKKLYELTKNLETATQNWLNSLPEADSIKLFLEELANKFKKVLSILDPLTDINQVQEVVVLIDSYLITQQLFLQSASQGELEKFKALESARQALSNQNQLIKRSLKALEDDTFDLTQEIEDFCSDRVILNFLKGEAVKEQKKQTEALLEDRDPKLTTVEQIKKLTNAWTTAVNAFVKDAQSGQDKGQVDPVDIANPDTQKTLVDFFCIHANLETLYTRLANTKIVQQIS